MYCRSPSPHLGGSWGVRPEWGLQAHTQGEVEGIWHGGLHAHTRRVSRPTPGGLQAHTQEGSWGFWHGGGLQAHTRGVSRPTPGGSPGPHPGGVSRPTPRGVSRPTPGGEGVSIPACTEASLLECILFQRIVFVFHLLWDAFFPAGMSLHLYLFFPLPTFASMYWSAHTNRLWISLKRLLRLHVIIFEKKKNESYFIEQVTINFDIALRSFPIPLLKNLAWYIQFSEKNIYLIFQLVLDGRSVNQQEVVVLLLLFLVTKYYKSNCLKSQAEGKKNITCESSK